MQKRFSRDYNRILEQEDINRASRNVPINVSDTFNVHPVNILSGLLMLWPPHDLRYQEHGTIEDPIMVDIIKGAETRIIRRDLTLGIVEVVVEFQKNLDEFERYNLVIKEHNKEWKKNGSPETVFDPVHGDIYVIKDQFVDPVHISSSHFQLPDSVYDNKSTGALAQARPVMQHKAYVQVVYQVTINGDKFTLSYAAFDYNDRVIYYNKVSHYDLSCLIEKSIQEIWGNPTVFKAGKNLLDGVSMLIQGKKISICKKDNILPDFLMSTPIKIKDTKEIVTLEMIESSLSTTSNFFSYIAPFALILSAVFCLLWTLVSLEGYQETLFLKGYMSGVSLIPMLILEVLSRPQMICCIILLMGIILFRKISQISERKASQLRAMGRFK